MRAQWQLLSHVNYKVRQKLAIIFLKLQMSTELNIYFNVLSSDKGFICITTCSCRQCVTDRKQILSNHAILTKSKSWSFTYTNLQKHSWRQKKTGPINNGTEKNITWQVTGIWETENNRIFFYSWKSVIIELILRGRGISYLLVYAFYSLVILRAK